MVEISSNGVDLWDFYDTYGRGFRVFRLKWKVYMRNTGQEVKKRERNSQRPHPLFPVVVFIYSGSPEYLA